MEQTFWQRYCDIRDEQWEAEREAARGDEIRLRYRIDAIMGWVLRAMWWGQIAVVLALMWLCLPAPSPQASQAMHQERTMPAKRVAPHPSASSPVAPVRTFAL